MPELPEVETIKNTVAQQFIGAVIKDVIVRQSKLRETVPGDLPQRIRNAKIVALRRIAKYMLVDLDNGLTLIWHFGMSGKVIVESVKPEILDKHDHLLFITDKGVLIYNDPRRFGLVTYVESEKLRQSPYFCHLGPDPWDKVLTPEFLKAKLQNKKCPIKVALLNQEIVVGIGNIYASEILYRSRIRPDRPSETLTLAEIGRIIKFTRIVLEEAIKAGGSTIHDYRHPDGGIGYFQQQHCVYDKTGQRCPDCKCDLSKTQGIRKIILGGRSTVYCPTLQK